MRRGRKFFENENLLIYVGTAIFIILAIFASTLGSLIASKMKYIKVLFGIIIIILGLNYMDLLKIAFLNKTKGINSN